MMLAWLPFAMALVACMAAARPATEPAPAFDGMALYRSGRMHELREQLRARLRAPSRSADVAARDAILLARTYIDLCVVWDAGSLDDASAVLAAARPSAPSSFAEVEQATGEVLFWRSQLGARLTIRAPSSTCSSVTATSHTSRKRAGSLGSRTYRFHRRVLPTPPSEP